MLNRTEEMKNKKDRPLENLWISRRQFLKGTGSAAGILLAGRLWPNRSAFASGAGGNRVVVVNDDFVTTWDGSSLWYGSNAYVNQSRVDNMISQGLMALTGESS
jgi:hypothetical protein